MIAGKRKLSVLGAIPMSLLVPTPVEHKASHRENQLLAAKAYAWRHTIAVFRALFELALWGTFGS
jgi:hypothetical protein